MNAASVVRVICTLAATLALPAAQAQQARVSNTHPLTARSSLSGLWETEAGVALLSGEIGKDPANPPAAKIPAPKSADPIGEALLARVKLYGMPPYNAEWLRKSRSAIHVAPAGAPRLGTACDMADFPEMMELPGDGMFELLVTPGETLLLTLYGTARHIYTDGRPHPRSEDLWPTAMGDSIGHWHGATLSIDTIARKAGPIAPIPIPGIANLSDQAHFTEILRLIDADTLQNDMTLDDPERFEHPWRISIRYKRAKDVDRMIPIDCAEHERNVILNGHATIAPP